MTPKQFVRAYRKHGSVKAVSRETEGLAYSAALKVYHEAVELGLMERQPVGRKSRDAETKRIAEQSEPVPEPKIEGRVKALKTRKFKLPPEGEINRYLFTSAQNNTLLHEGFWTNLLAYNDFNSHRSHEAGLHVSRFTYVKTGLGARGDKAQLTRAKKEELYDGDTLVFDSRIDDYLSDKRVEVAPGLVWCGEQNILPTAVRPLSGYETYTGRRSGIFPHVKFAMESVASGKHEGTKFNYTTGSCTMRNYIQRKAGLKAEFHHCYGALIVEVDSDGDWFVRQINADSDGTFYDLDVMVKNGKVTEGHRVEAVNCGDLHAVKASSEAVWLAWDAEDSILSTLDPKFVFLHDVLDFRSRNHHDRHDPFRMYERHIEGGECVNEEVALTMRLIYDVAKTYRAHFVVVDSNHDRALERWLRESDWKRDPINMLFYMRAATAKLESIKNGDDNFHMMRHWWKEMGFGNTRRRNVQFLDEDESFVICHDAHGGIECGMHGHLGVGGMRGSPHQFAKMGRKANTGHTHAAGIRDGIYTAGTMSELDMGWNVGPSNWSNSFIVTYPNGKRAIITCWNSKWRAM